MKRSVLLVAVLAVLPYLKAIDGPFVFDDVKLVRDNPSIRDLSRILETFNVFSHRWDEEELRANYRPLRFLSYAIDYRITRWLQGPAPPEELSPRVFHLHNVLLHALNALLVLFVVRALLGGTAAPLFCALLFALHPLATEAVTYVSGRRDVLSTFFFLLALWTYLRGRGWLSALLVPPLFVLGLLTKEMVVTLPAVILLIDLARRARFDLRRVVLSLVLWTLAIGFTVFEARNPRLVAGAAGGSPLSALLTAPRYAARYLGLLLFPYPQSIDYSYDAIPVSRGLLAPWTTLPAIALWLALLAAGLQALRRGRLAPAVGLLWFLGVLLPVLQIVPIPERFAERFAYLPAIGLFLLLAALFRAAHARWPVPAALGGAALLAALGLLTLERNQDWLSPARLWGSAAWAQPRSARAHLGLGEALRAERRYAEATSAYTRSLSIFGDRPPASLASGRPALARSDELLRWGQVLQARTFRAQCSAELGAEDPARYQSAIDDYRWLLSQRDIDGTEIADSPRHVVLHYQLALCLRGLGAAESSPSRARELAVSSTEELRRVAKEEKLQPALARNAHYYLAKTALGEARSDEGLKELEEAFRIAREAGDSMDRYRLVGELADLLIARGNLDRADEILVASLGELGRQPDRKHLLYRRARVSDRRGDAASTQRALEEALEIDPRYGPALLSLASLEEARSNLDRAEELYRRLLEVAPGEPRAARGLKGIQLRRELQKQGNDDPARKASDQDRVVLEGLIGRAEGHLARGEYLAAVEPLRRAALPSPSGGSAADRDLRALALRRLAGIARKLHKLPEAEGYLAAAISADPESHEPLRDLADLELRELKDHEAAARTYQEYLDQLPPGRLAEPYVYFNLGSLLEKNEPFHAADLFLRAGKAGAQDPDLQKILGYRLANLGRWEDALESFQSFLDLSVAAAAGEKEGSAALEREKVRRFIEESVLPRLKEGPPPAGSSPAGEER
jgi:hypothetical protein